eukprot:9982080-Alexandrium_andersonii.AAC.1
MQPRGLPLQARPEHAREGPSWLQQPVAFARLVADWACQFRGCCPLEALRPLPGRELPQG